MKVFIYNISLSLKKGKNTIYNYIVISVVLTLNLIIPAISISHSVYVSETLQNKFLYSDNKYYYDWTSRLLSKNELNDIASLYNNHVLILCENIVEINNEMAQILACNKDVFDDMNFQFIDGDKKIYGNKIIVDINFLKKMDLKLGDGILINSNLFHITGVCNLHHRADIIMNYNLFRNISSQTNIQQMAIFPNLETYNDFEKSFFNDNELYSIHSNGLLNDYIEKWEQSTKQSNIITICFSVLLFTFGCVSIFIILKNKLMSDYKDFAIMRCLGASKTSIVITYLSDYAIIFFISLLFIVITFPQISKFFYISNYLVWNIKSIITLLIVSSLIMIIVGIYFTILIANKTLLQNLNIGEEKNV